MCMIHPQGHEHNLTCLRLGDLLRGDHSALFESTCLLRLFRIRAPCPFLSLLTRHMRWQRTSSQSGYTMTHLHPVITNDHRCEGITDCEGSIPETLCWES